MSDRTQPDYTIYHITELRYLQYLAYRKAIVDFLPSLK